ncbi:AMP-binding protein [uncultured Jatrophihabitans sp.]|uniref:AMP-binding protein n=1 Tax=uncultured Jatrophihabitans sp. TaxID=1610747 RepID=UPI0035CAE4EF
MTSGSRPLLALGDDVVTAAELDDRVGRAAAALRAAGVQPGDSTAVMVRNDLAWYEANLAAEILGALPVQVNWHSTDDEVLYVLKDAGVKVLVANPDFIERLAPNLPSDVTVVQVEPHPEVVRAYKLQLAPVPGVPHWRDWTAWPEAVAKSYEVPDEMQAPRVISYTSGSTGRPKGVRRIPRAINMDAAKQVAGLLGLPAPTRRGVVVSPLYHTAPASQALTTVKSGGFQTIMPRFDPVELLALVERHRVNFLMLVPTMMVRMLALTEDERTRYDLSSLVKVVHGAGPCPVSVKERVIAWLGPIVGEYYGGTEAGCATFATSADALAHPGTVGRAVPGVHLRILDEHGHEVPVGEIGEIFIKTEIFDDFEYIGNSAGRAEVGRDGFVTQGDLGYLDRDGYLFLAGRAREMVVCGGVNIYTIEIENILARLPGVALAAAFAVPDAELGEAVGVAVELDGTREVGADDIRAYVREELGGLKVPAVVEFVDYLTRSDVGKVFKRAIAAKYWPVGAPA